MRSEKKKKKKKKKKEKKKKGSCWEEIDVFHLRELSYKFKPFFFLSEIAHDSSSFCTRILMMLSCVEQMVENWKNQEILLKGNISFL